MARMYALPVYRQIEKRELELLMEYKNKPCVYLLKSDKSKLYVGSTIDLPKRLREHNTQGNTRSKSTKGESKWRLFYTKYFDKIEEARFFERKIKSSRFARDSFYKEAGLSKYIITSNGE